VDAAAQLEGLGVPQYLNGGGLAFDITNEPGYEAIDRSGTNELPDWIVDVTTPSLQTVDENFTVQEESDGDSLGQLFDTTGRATKDGAVIQPTQQSFTRYVESKDDDTGFVNEQGSGPADSYAVNGVAYGTGAAGQFVSIDEKHACFDVMVLAEFHQELFCQNNRSDGKESDVQEFVRSGIDGGVQPVALVVESNHGFVDRDVIRVLAGRGL